MIKNFKSFLNESTKESINEAYPAILKDFSSSDKNYFSKAFGINDKSEVIEIPKEDIAKKQYAGLLYVFVDKDDKPFAYGYDTNVINVKRGNTKLSRKAAAEYAAKIYGISKDPENKEKISARYAAQVDNTQKDVVNNRIKNLMDSHSEELLKAVSKMKEDLKTIDEKLLSSLEERIKNGYVYDKDSLYGKVYDSNVKEDLALKNEIINLIGRIGHVFYSANNSSYFNDKPEDVIRFSKSVLKLIDDLKY